jgi:LDH2 family malate/lactate/ureidoglycolate dehydrogenase
VPREDADILADILLTANLRGIDSHGVLRTGFYANKLRDGGIKPKVELVPIRETVGTALLDGQDGIGQIISHRAMQMAIRKAKDAGISFVTIKNSNHFGTCAYYSMMALPENMIGFCTTNASPRLAPTGGVSRIFGNNPFCYAIPTERHLPVVLDMAISVVTGGKLRIFQKEGKPIPEGWALSKFGEPTTDASEGLKGILLAIGGPKGYGMAFIMDLLSGVLSNSNYGPRVAGMEVADRAAGVSHSFMAIDISAFDDVAKFKARVDGYIDEIKSSEKARGCEEIYIPGELEFIREAERRKKGIPLQRKIFEELCAIGKEYGVPAEF